MEEIFNLENYKEHLIKFYRYECEKDAYLERVPYIERIGDSTLQKYIDDTKTFCYILLDKLKREYRIFEGSIFTKIDIEEDRKSIFTNLRGGWSPDTIYHYCTKEYDLNISRYLMNRFFENARIYLDEDEIETCDGEIYNIYCYPVIHISMNENKFQELYDQYGNELTRTLKKK